MTTSIPSEKLYPYLTHRPPMVWIDEVLDYSETSGITMTLIKEDGYYCTGGKFRITALIEFIAQAYAFTALAYLLDKKITVNNNKNYLAAIKNFKPTDGIAILPGMSIRTEVKKSRTFGPISIISGECYYQNQLLGSAELKVFSE